MGTEAGMWPPSLKVQYDRMSTPKGAVYKFMNSGTILGRVRYLLPFLKAAAANNDSSLAIHELFYDTDGNYIPKFEYTRRFANIPLAPPVYRRNDQIVMALLYLTNATVVTLDFRGEISQAMFIGIDQKAMRKQFAFNKTKSTVFRLEDKVTPGALHFNGDSKAFYTNILRKKLALGWQSDDAVAEKHGVHLIDRAMHPPPPQFDINGVDFNSTDTLVQRFNFTESCTPMDALTDDLLWFVK